MSIDVTKTESSNNGSLARAFFQAAVGSVYLVSGCDHNVGVQMAGYFYDRTKAKFGR